MSTMYLANCIRPDISFAVNLLARCSSSPTQRHWNVIKHVFRYLQGTIDLGLFYPKSTNREIVGFADAGYLSDPHKLDHKHGIIHSWRNCYIMALSEANTSSHFLQPC